MTSIIFIWMKSSMTLCADLDLSALRDGVFTLAEVQGELEMLLKSSTS